jgi:hypothetical protein
MDIRGCRVEFFPERQADLSLDLPYWSADANLMIRPAFQ